jgi:BclB C-terminal domain-containing protein
MAFSVPRDGTITNMVAFFSNVVAQTLTGTVRIYVQLYQAPQTSNTFTALSGAIVTLTSLSGSITLGQITSGFTPGLSIPVTAQTRLLLVFYITNDSPVASTITGYASAGITIA